MKTIRVEIYSCYEKTYLRIYKKVLSYLYGELLKKYEIQTKIIDLSKYCKNKKAKSQVQAQRSLTEFVTRAIYIFEDNELTHIVGVSNTNKDYDSKYESELDPSIGYIFNDPTRPYHGNAYFKQGTPKLFNYYFEKKQEFPNLKLSFYLLDIELGIPNNLFNCLTWRELQTLGFSILNIDEIDFSLYEKKANSQIIDKNNIGFSSFNKYINDVAIISQKNKGNNPSFLQTYEEFVQTEDGDVFYIQKYIYIFKSLSAQAYDSLFRILCLKVLADKENTEIEFKLGAQYFGFSEPESKISDKLAKPVIETFKNFNVSITYTTNDEFMEEKRQEEKAYMKAKKNNNPRNQLLFRNNLRKKGVPIRCVICGNDDPFLLKAAHLWEVNDIKNSSKETIDNFIKINNLESLIDATSKHYKEFFYKKYCLTNSGDNGVWLCGTHHDMFDQNYYCFNSDDGEVHILHFNTEKQLNEFVNSLKDGMKTSIDKNVLTNATKAFLTMRNEKIL